MKQKREKTFKQSTEFQIFRNYGVLSAEKRSVYTYGGSHPRSTCADEVRVFLPENDNFGIFLSESGELRVSSAWGWDYEISEVLQGDLKPCFCAVDKDGKEHRLFLKEA